MKNEVSIKTVTPAAISKVRGRSQRLQLRVTIKIIGGHKLIARRDNCAQEIFIITQLTKLELQQVIDKHKPKSLQQNMHK